MATSGTINGSCTGGSGGKYDIWASWKRNSYSIADCSSNITIDIYVQRNDGYAGSAYNLEVKPSVSLKVGGASKTATTYYVDTRNSAKCKIATWTGDVDHKTDGSLTLPIAASFSLSGLSSLTGGSLSGNAEITTIPQASSIDSLSCATKYFDGTMTYKYTPKSASFYNRCNIALNLSGEYIAVKTINIGKKSASQQTATVSLSASELAIIYNELPSTTEGTLRFTFRTYSDSAYTKQVGDAGYKEITLNIPENSTTKPSVSVTLTPVSTLPSTFASVYVQGKSKVKASITASGKNNATIKSYNMSVGGNTYDSADDYTSVYLSKSGNIKVTGYATDSRKFTGSDEKEITVYPYDKPKIQPISGESEVIAARCDKDGNFTDSGTYLKIRAKRNYSSVNGKNTCSIRYRYKAEKASSFSAWTTILSGTASGNEVTTAPLLNGGLLATNTYIVQVGVIDAVGEDAYTTITVPTDKVYMHRDGARRSLAFGEYIQEDNTFSVAEDITFKVKNKGTDATVVSDTGWVNLGLADGVVERENSAGRIGKGCYYRVINGNHVYVAFCCEFEINNNSVIINMDSIPAEYRPQCSIYQICIASNKAVAGCDVNIEGDVRVNWVQTLLSNSMTYPYNVSWVDGYIDYWITDR